MKIISVVGARPNFMKIAQFIKSIHEVNTASSPLLGGDAGVRLEGRPAEGVKSIHAVNTASSPLLGGDAGVRPEAQEAEGVNSIHAMTASSPPSGELEGASSRFPCSPSRQNQLNIPNRQHRLKRRRWELTIFINFAKNNCYGYH